MARVNRLTIIGASVRAAAQSAARAGFSPYAIDCFADRDLAELCPATRIDNYPRGFWRAMAAAPDAPWMVTGGLENYPRLIERLAGLRPLWGNPPDVLREVRDPRKLRRILADANLSMPGEPKYGERALLKPLRGSAGLGIRGASEREFAHPPRGSHLQKFVEGMPASAAFVAAGGNAVLLGATRQLLGRDWGHQLPFLYVGSIGPLALSDVQSEQIVQLGQVLAQQFRLVGLFGVDLVMDGERVWTIEVNPRYTASMEILERVTGESFIAMHASACQLNEGVGSLWRERPPSIGKSTSAKDSRPPGAARCFGKAVVYARQELTIGNHMPWDDPAVSGQFADLPHGGQIIQASHPIVTVFAEGDSTVEVETKLRARADALLP
jgi:predicted ATP-grasp superfamily ATP-dependent carboligase